MKLQNIVTTSLAIATISFTLVGCGNPSQQHSRISDVANRSENIFAEAEAPAQFISALNSSETQKLRYVRVNIPALKRILNSDESRTLRLNFFDDQDVDVLLEEIDRKSADNIVVVGRIVGDSDSAVSLVLNGDVLIGNVRRGDSNENFEVRAVANGVHSVRLPKEDLEENCEVVKEDAHEAEASTGDLEQSLHASVLASPVVKVLGAYTPSARANQGGTKAIVALIQKGIADTNRALADSGSSLRVQLVGTMETKSNESSNIATDLAALRSRTDSRFNEVHSMRVKLKADQVSLVGGYARYNVSAGIGYFRSTYSNAFTVTKAAYFGQYTFSHELGHNLGLDHSDGYQNSSGRFRTIIAYGNYPRIRRYSNPSITYSGYKTGDSRHNETKILNANAVRMSLLVP